MRFACDHDLHIHTYLSNCSKDVNQTPENIIKYAKNNNLNTICFTDHYWDSSIPYNTADNPWYQNQNFEHVSQIKPLPQAQDIRSLFGCEVEMGADNEIAMPEFRYNDFDFIIVSTTHFHLMAGKNWDNADEIKLVSNWIDRFDAVLNSNLPFKKVGLAHLSTPHIYRKDRKKYLEILDLISLSELKRLFAKTAELGIGVELNSSALCFAEEETNTILRMFKVAKDCGCKFYLGSDAHRLNNFNQVNAVFNRAIDLLQLEETDKFIL